MFSRRRTGNRARVSLFRTSSLLRNERTRGAIVNVVFSAKATPFAASRRKVPPPAGRFTFSPSDIYLPFYPPPTKTMRRTCTKFPRTAPSLFLLCPHSCHIFRKLWRPGSCSFSNNGASRKVYESARRKVWLRRRCAFFSGGFRRAALQRGEFKSLRSVEITYYYGLSLLYRPAKLSGLVTSKRLHGVYICME